MRDFTIWTAPTASMLTLQGMASTARRRFATGDIVALVLLLIGLVVVFLTFQDYGVAFDEGVQDDYGRYVLHWYLSLGEDRHALTFLDLFYYGGAFDLVAAILQHVSPFHHFETRHLLNAVVGMVGIIGCWRLARRMIGPWGGAFAAAVLALMPSWYGMMFIDPKDIPFAVGMIWGVYYMVVIADHLPAVPRSLVLKLAVVIGLTLGTRIGGVLLFGYLGILLALHVLRAPVANIRERVRLALRLGVAVLLPTVVIAWLVMLVFWPYAQTGPISHPLNSILHFGAYAPRITTLFFGTAADNVNRPLLYLPVYVLIKMPEVDDLLLALAVVLAAAGLWGLRHRWRDIPLPQTMLAVAIVFPLAYVLVSRPELYDADRHFLFLLPPIAIACTMAAFTLIRRLDRRDGTIVATALILAGVLGSVPAMHNLHPYEYAYLNRFVGGVAGGRGEFETEYWGSALTEAAQVLRARLHAEGHRGLVRVAICGNDKSVEEPLAGIATMADDPRKADFTISTTRHNCDRTMPGNTIARISRDGVPFAVVKDVHPMTARNSWQPHS